MRLRVVLASAAALVAVLVVIGVTGRSGAGADGGPATVAWRGTPQVYKPPMLPEDRIMSARLRNTSLRPLDLVAEDIRLLDPDGRPVRSTARFLETYVHGLFPPSQRPETPNPNEQRQLGEIITIKPGADVPLTLSWRLAPGGKAPVRADLGPVSLPLP